MRLIADAFVIGMLVAVGAVGFCAAMVAVIFVALVVLNITGYFVKDKKERK